MPNASHAAVVAHPVGAAPGASYPLLCSKGDHRVRPCRCYAFQSSVARPNAPKHKIAYSLNVRLLAPSMSTIYVGGLGPGATQETLATLTLQPKPVRELFDDVAAVRPRAQPVRTPSQGDRAVPSPGLQSPSPCCRRWLPRAS